MQPTFQRPVSPDCFRLDPEAVHIWWLDLNPPPQTLPGRMAFLSEDEKARAARFHFEIHRRRYIAGRAGLRRLLGGYLGLDPAAIVFSYTPQGKPYLPTRPTEPVLQFNLSNSDERALLAFRWQRLVGIDLELVHPMPDEDDFARQFFCASECALLRSFSGAEKTRVFFELWTAKEAFLKAMGSGLTTPINEVEVSLQAGAARLLAIAGDPRPAADWQLRLFTPAPGYQAALALPGAPGPISFYDAPDDFGLRS